MEFLVMLLAFGAFMYFLMIRPQQKRMREHQATLDALQPGARVLLTSGMFGTLRHVGARQVIVELAPGAEVTMLKSNIVRPAKDDEEEFEFSDEDVLEDDTYLSEEITAPETGLGDVPQEYREETFDPRPVDADEPRKHDN